GAVVVVADAVLAGAARHVEDGALGRGDRDADGAETGDRRRAEEDDAGDHAAAERAPAAEREDDGRGGRLAPADEDRLRGQDEVDARRLHGGDRPDGARELALEGAPVEDPLLELGRAEAHLVEALEADGAAARQAGARE